MSFSTGDKVVKPVNLSLSDSRSIQRRACYLNHENVRLTARYAKSRVAGKDMIPGLATNPGSGRRGKVRLMSRLLDPVTVIY